MDSVAEYSAEQKREIGKSYVFDKNADAEKKKYGMQLIFEAYKEKDPEATYHVAHFILRNWVILKEGDPFEHAMNLMRISANAGYIQARAFLNSFCATRYKSKMDAKFTDNKYSGPLVDFNGKAIKINRKGIFTPVDAVLEYTGGQNILTLSTNVAFVYTNTIENAEQFEQAVYRGILAWQGEYEVFGGQKLTVKVNVTNNNNIFDNLVVFPVTEDLDSMVRSFADRIATDKRKKDISRFMDSKRSFAAIASFRWTVNSRKSIFLQSDDGKFDNYDEIMHVTKHEFGHALGLGDLYADADGALPGVKEGTYDELDCYLISDRYYNLVMCDHYGPISNNDIEMVIFAYQKNKMQLYQQKKRKDKISDVLGKGN